MAQDNDDKEAQYNDLLHEHLQSMLLNKPKVNFADFSASEPFTKKEDPPQHSASKIKFDL